MNDGWTDVGKDVCQQSMMTWIIQRIMSELKCNEIYTNTCLAHNVYLEKMVNPFPSDNLGPGHYCCKPIVTTVIQQKNYLQEDNGLANCFSSILIL